MKFDAKNTRKKQNGRCFFQDLSAHKAVIVPFQRPHGGLGLIGRASKLKMTNGKQLRDEVFLIAQVRSPDSSNVGYCHFSFVGPLVIEWAVNFKVEARTYAVSGGCFKKRRVSHQSMTEVHPSQDKISRPNTLYVMRVPTWNVKNNTKHSPPKINTRHAWAAQQTPTGNTLSSRPSNSTSLFLVLVLISQHYVKSFDNFYRGPSK